MRRFWLLGIITFLSAFLMFQIELITAKKFLPVYGGSYLVWGACMVFFQAALLLGYVAAHYGTKFLGAGRYLRWHLVLMLVPFLFFPGRPLHVESTHWNIPLSMDVFFRLAVTIGPVFFVLATVSLVTQMWLGHSRLKRESNPYFLYGISNIGSFLALFTYPFLFERYLTLTQQLTIWRGLYGILFLVTAAAFLIIKTGRRAEVVHEEKTARASLSRDDVIRWFLLGAGGVMVFLGVNNIITMKIAPLLLLWIIPLGLYLLAYVLNFKRRPWCPAWIDTQSHSLIGFGFLFFLISAQRTLPMPIELLLMLVILFGLCMYCQRRLYRSRPDDQEQLTAFYVVMSLGGFAGGMIVTWIVPLIFTDILEFWIGLIVISLAYIWEVPRRRGLAPYFIRVSLVFMAMLVVWPIFCKSYNFWAFILLFFSGWMVFRRLAESRFGLSFFLIAALCLWPSIEPFWTKEVPVYRERNFYGSYDVVDKRGVRTLYNGDTLHGAQVLAPRFRHIPTTYYSRGTPVGKLIEREGRSFKRMGIAGLGVGTLAAYSKAGRVIDFYELDPDIARIARKYFTYLSDAQGKVNIIFGDARLSVERRKGKPYDLIVVDTFGSDAIPFHLLTKEMVRIYRKNLTDNGVLLFHITNRYLRLDPILARVGGALGADVSSQRGAALNTDLTLHTAWVAMTWSQKQARLLRSDLGWVPLNENSYPGVRPWTDDYIYVLPVIETGKVLKVFKDFKIF